MAAAQMLPVGTIKCTASFQVVPLQFFASTDDLEQAWLINTFFLKTRLRTILAAICSRSFYILRI